MRRIKWTVLAVGEGDAEEAFLRHLQDCYITRGCGTALKIQQAYGKGARNVVRHAIRYKAGQDFNRSLVLFDTDTDYDGQVIAEAAQESLTLIPADPCLEAMLLGLCGDVRQRTSAQHKAEFGRRFGGRVQDPGVLPRHFPKECLEAARDRNQLLHLLINTFGIPRN